MKLVEATILVRGHQNWIDAITGRYQAKLGLLRSKPSGKGDEVLQLFEITVDRKLKDRLLRYLQNDPEILELQITNSSHGRLVGLMRTKGVIMRCIADSDCFLVNASNESGEPIAWRVLGTAHSLRSLVLRLRRKGIEYKTGDISEVRRKRVLTARQEWLLRSAYQRGYFDYPKRIRIRPLAKLLGISAPTLYESLRKTQKKLLQEHFLGTPGFGN